MTMFIDQHEAFNDQNHCSHCRWLDSNMCPGHIDFVGRPMAADHVYQSINMRLCHRFVMNNEERQRRWEMTMEKLNENLPEGDIFN